MTLKLPICTFDAKTGILCASCESKLRKGQISRADVEASKAIVRLSDSVGGLGNVILRRASEAGGSYLLEVEQAGVASLRSDPSILSRLESGLGGRVWIARADASERRFLEDVLFPARVLTVNTLWLPDGEKRTKVIVPSARNDRRFGDFGKLRDAVKNARGIELLVETEREAGLRQR